MDVASAVSSPALYKGALAGLGIPYWRLSGFYFFYFAALGAWLPYWGLFLQSEGFDAIAIGYLSAILMLSKVVAPSIWGWLGDRYGQRLRLIRWGSLAALCAFAGVFVRTDFGFLAVVIAVYSFFWNAILPQFEVVTLAWLGQHYRYYSLIRVWGSIGFIVAVALLGLWFDSYSVQSLPWIVSALLLGIWLSSLSLPPARAEQCERPSGSLWQVLLRPGVLMFFLASFLLQFSHGPYYTFFSIYLESQEISRVAIGLLWSLGVLAEVLLFTRMHDILYRYSLRGIFLTSLLLSALRWWLIAEFADQFVLLLVAQLLHAASFGASHAVAIEFVRRFFGEGHQGQGQAIYSGLSFGAGGALGALVSGVVWEYSPAATFKLAAASCAVAALLAWWKMGGVLVRSSTRELECRQPAEQVNGHH